MDKMEVIHDIISRICSVVTNNMINSEKNGTLPVIWDEKKCGAEWIDNEVTVFNDIYSIYKPNYPIVDLSYCHNVIDCAVELYYNNTDEYINLLLAFIKNDGFSSCNLLD